MSAPAMRSLAMTSMKAQSLRKPEDDLSGVIVGVSTAVLVLMDLSAMSRCCNA